MNEKILILTVEEITVMLQSLQLMINHIAITDTDTYMQDFKSRVESVVQKILI